MLKIFFAEIKTGRLMRLQYLGYSLIIALLMFGFVFAVVLAIGIGEHILGGDLQEAQAQLRAWFTLPFMLVFAILMMLFTFMGLNIMAKRIRDIGLPGWWLVLILAVLGAAVSYFYSQQAASGLHTLSVILLLLIPTDAFVRR